MQCFTVSSNEIEGRLDCFFYSPKNQVSIKSKFPLVTVKDVTHNVIHPPEYKRIYAAYGYQLLRAQNVKRLGIDINSNKVFLDKDYLKGKKLISPEIGDVLIVRSGVNTGDCAVIEKDYVDLILGADNLVCKCNDKINPFFLKTYLSLNNGRKILSLYQTGATNYHITPENLKKIKIPLPPLSIQNQIVDIMQSAYNQKKQKEAEAQRLLNSIDSYVLEELGIKLPEVENKMFFVVDVEETNERIDTEYHNPFYTKFYKSLTAGKYNLAEIRDIATAVFQGVGKKVTDNPKYTLLKVKNIKKNNEVDYGDIEFVKDVMKSKVLNVGDIISPFIGEAVRQCKFSVFNKEDGLFVVDNNTGVIRIDSKKANCEYIAVVLNSQVGNIQLEHLIGGGGVPFLGANNAKKLKVPLPPLSNQNKIAEEVKRRMSEAERLKAEASKIIEEAKKQVEEMILGN